MTATDSHRMAGFDLRCRDAENNGAAEQGQAKCLDNFVTTTMNRRQIGIAIEMKRQRTLTPLVRKDIVLRGIEEVNTGHQLPLLPQHVTMFILHLIVIDDM